jgi:hypothetical protein
VRLPGGQARIFGVPIMSICPPVFYAFVVFIACECLTNDTLAIHTTKGLVFGGGMCITSIALYLRVEVVPQCREHFDSASCAKSCRGSSRKRRRRRSAGRAVLRRSRHQSHNGWSRRTAWRMPGLDAIVAERPGWVGGDPSPRSWSPRSGGATTAVP